MKIKYMSREQIKRIENFNCSRTPCDECPLKIKDPIRESYCVQNILDMGCKDRLIENGVSIDMRKVR